MAGKKKAKSTTATSSSSSKSISKKSTRVASGKQGASSSSSAKAVEGEAVAYGVVASEYNIQAQIDWLTAPPSSGDKKNLTNLPPPPSKKPQRGYHHDLCDGCGEGEYLMYCDKCPAAYHCICDDPPLPPEDYETIGVNWKCKKCRISALKAEQGGDEVGADAEEGGCDGSIKSIFNKLIIQAQTQNPVQFKLSKEYPAYDYPFPGTSRHLLKKARQRTSVVEVENGIIPKPTVLCFQCALSCRIGPLIQCDKCDLYFHLDCLDPPLTTIPTTVWICPLHVEPHLESKQLTSVALSERVKIWEQAEVPVNRPAVVLNFVSKARKTNPMFRRKQPIPMLSNSAVIPEMVANCYKETVDVVQERFSSLNALAYVCEVEKLNFEMKQQVDFYREKMIKEYMPAGKSLVEQRAKLEFLRSRNISKLNHLRNVFEMYLRNRELQSAGITSSGPSPAKAPKTYDSVTDILNEMDLHSQNGEESKDSQPIETKADMAKPIPEPAPQLPETVSTSRPKETKDNEADTESVPQWVWNELKAADADVDADMKSLNELSRDVRKVGEILMEQNKQRQSFRQDPVLAAHAQKPVSVNLPFLRRQSQSQSHAEVPPTTNGQATLGIPESAMRKIKGKSDPLPMDIIKNLPRKIVNKLAACHLRNALKKKALKEAKASKEIPRPETESIPPDITLFMQIENTGEVFEITKRAFSIGSGNDCDLKITDFVECNRIQDEHAKVFFNPLENCYEVLNYSSFGITVNNIKYGLSAIESPTKSVATDRQQELEKIVDKRIEEYLQLHPDKLSSTDKVSCYCKPFPSKSLPTVYEGSIKLHPGYRLEIGCAKLLFERFEYR